MKATLIASQKVKMISTNKLDAKIGGDNSQGAISQRWRRNSWREFCGVRRKFWYAERQGERKQRKSRLMCKLSSEIVTTGERMFRWRNQADASFSEPARSGHRGHTACWDVPAETMTSIEPWGNTRQNQNRNTLQDNPPTHFKRASLRAQLVKNPSAVQETPVRFLGGEDPLEKA